MRQQQPLDPRLGGHVHGVGGGRMAPVRLGRELVVGVLAVVDQQVHVLAELEDVLGDGAAVQRRLVVRHVGDGAPLGLNAETERHARVRHGPGHHLGRPDGEVLGPDVNGDELAAELLHVDGEHGRLHRRVQRVLQGALGLRRPVDREAGARIVEGAEERDPQNVVEVQMGQQRRGVHGGAERTHLPVQHVAVGAQPGAEVDDERIVPLNADHQAGGVAAIAAVAITRARARPPHAVERDVHPLNATPPRSSTFSAHGVHCCERARVRLPVRGAGGRATGALPPRIPRHGAHLALSPSRAGRRRVPGRGAVPAGLRADVGGRRRSLPGGSAGARCQRPARRARRR